MIISHSIKYYNHYSYVMSIFIYIMIIIIIIMVLKNQLITNNNDPRIIEYYNHYSSIIKVYIFRIILIALPTDSFMNGLFTF